MKVRRIKVTEDHIERGVRRSTCLCPVALAIREQTKIKGALVSFDVSVIERDQMRRVAKLPQTVVAFIRDFDNIRCVDPFEFDLELLSDTA